MKKKAGKKRDARKKIARRRQQGEDIEFKTRKPQEPAVPDPDLADETNVESGMRNVTLKE
jgi:hypothetical protein